ncbi:hypothetical protein GCM10010994_03560 [Chelatococcus reniformis]|uniref:Uncharacterized protein n=1 Tax=Chelatococcus reniformis TaxID=1494448 RepID=A0A916TXQ3_9HYPH|nr:hypothetical protein GCM10010994_03560 [Chelatococcus reniformis]
MQQRIGRDCYWRTLAHFELNGRDIGPDVVRAGQALPFVRYSREYVPHAAGARSAKADVGRAISCRHSFVSLRVRATFSPAESGEPSKGNGGEAVRIWRTLSLLEFNGVPRDGRREAGPCPSGRGGSLHC